MKLASQLALGIREWRQRLRLSQAELAEKAAISSKYLSRLECMSDREHENPTLEVLESICKALDTTLLDLLEGIARPVTTPRPPHSEREWLQRIKQLSPRKRTLVANLLVELAERPVARGRRKKR